MAFREQTYATTGPSNEFVHHLSASHGGVTALKTVVCHATTCAYLVAQA